MMSETYGLLIDYEYCTGCESCVVSCKEEHGYPVGKWGIRVYDDGPWNIEGDMFNFNRIPSPPIFAISAQRVPPPDANRSVSIIVWPIV
jgi:ferredoxin